jgi:alkylation response protein AidB-like acyl-CoA dehydrogenase
MVDAGAVLATLGRALDPGPWLSTAVAAPRALRRLGTGEAAVKLLTRIAEGTAVATVGLAERGARPCWTAPATHASGGPDIVVTGEKVDVPDAHAATTLLVVAVGHEGPALFGVETPAPGVEVTPQPSGDLTRTQSRVRFDGAPARYLGPAPPAAVQAVVDDVLAAWAADALGAAEAAFALAIDHVRLSPSEAVQHVCVDMYETVQHARGAVTDALRAADGDDPEAHHLAAVRVKAFAGQLAMVGDTAVRVLDGGDGTEAQRALRHLRRLLGWSAFLGSPGPYLLELGRQLTQPARA